MPIPEYPEKRSIGVELSKDEYLLAITTGINRAEAHLTSTPMNKKDGVESHCEGAVGEMLVCKWFKVNFDNSVEETGIYPGDTDIRIGGVLIDVKAVTYQGNPWLLVKKNLIENGEAEIYINVLLEESESIPHRGEILGWRTSDWIQEHKKPKRKPREFLNYISRWSDLRYTEDLYDKLDGEYDEEDTVRENVTGVLQFVELDWLTNGMDKTPLNKWKGDS